MNIAKLVKNYSVGHPAKFRLSDWDPADTGGLDINKDDSKHILSEDIARLSDLQQRLYAQGRYALLIIFQAMDAAGKDSAIKHVMTGLNPQGCEVYPFKAPSTRELAHDFLWRAVSCLPARGNIGIFNRSYYEEVLVVRVKPEVLAKAKVPPELVTKRIWKERYQDIRAFERHLMRNGTVILKFFLNVSSEEQRRRFLERIDDPAKRWKFSMGDVADRKLWDKYMDAYEHMIRETSTAEAPWHVVPADSKWFTRLVVSATIVRAMERLDLQFPKVEGAALAELMRARKALLAKRPGRSRTKVKHR